jgi:hypothetical protein
MNLHALNSNHQIFQEKKFKAYEILPIKTCGKGESIIFVCLWMFMTMPLSTPLSEQEDLRW